MSVASSDSKLRELPILFVVFNRPEETRRVWERIKRFQPRTLFVAGDGPRANSLEDQLLCAEVRALCEDVDWECDVKFLWREENIGVEWGVKEAIDWCFQYVDRLAILEDDCLPSSSFFMFCDDMLTRFETDENVMLVSGFNAAGSWKHKQFDYFFAHTGGIWGWATWRRAWDHYSHDMPGLEMQIASRFFRKTLGRHLGKVREQQFMDTKEGRVSTWGYRWAHARHVAGGVAVVPTVSLIENIGFSETATHTKKDPNYGRISAQELTFPLRPSPRNLPDMRYDRIFFPSRTRRLTRKLRYLIQSFLTPALKK